MSYFIDFDAEKIKLNKVYESNEVKENFVDSVSGCEKTKTVYGEFKMPEYPKTRPYLYGSFVMSIDGKIAFKESPDGTLIARSNKYDPDGGTADYWILNLLRAASDASLMGANTIAKEPELTSRVHDKDLQQQRAEEGLLPIPIHVVTTASGKNFPADHFIVKSSEIPMIILTSPNGLEELQKTLTEPYDVIMYDGDMEEQKFTTGNLVIATGNGSETDIPAAMQALKKLGINRMVVESPIYLSLLMQEKMLDELFLNASSIFIGGDALSIAETEKSFTVEQHPHTQVMSIHSHSDFFFYNRYKILYD